MQNRFGLKDFVTLVLLLAVGVSVWLSMVQDDRKWRRMDALRDRIESIEKQLSAVQRGVDDLATNGVVVAGAASVQPGSNAGAGAAGRDESWARPGVPVTWSPPLDFSTDPYDDPNHTVGGEFIEIFEGQPPVITAYRYTDVYGRRVKDLVQESLGFYDPKTLKLRGLLAEAWQLDPGGMWLRVKIHPRARFSDGMPVTAEDVRYTFHDFIFNPQIQAERFRSVYNAIERVEPVSDKIVDFHFKEKRFDNLSQALGFPIIPKHFYEQFEPTQINTSTGLMMGSGPFKLVSLDPDNQWAPPEDIVLIRNDQYWGPKPPLASIRFKVVQESLARLTAYRNGEADMMRPIAAQFDEMSRDERFKAEHNLFKWFNMQGGYSWIGWQCGPRGGEGGRLTPFHDRRVRLAMTHLIDRERIMRDIEKGLTKPATGPFLSSAPTHNPNIKPWPHDLDKARQLLKEAGWEDRNNDGVLENERGDEFVFEFTFSRGSEGTLKMVTLVKDLCASVGIRCELRPVDWSIFETILNNRDFDAITMAWSASAPESDPQQVWHSSSIQNQGDNFIQWASAEADRLIEAGRREVDDEKRMAIWHELHRVIHEEQPYTFLSEIPYLRFVRKRVGNFQPYPSGIEYRELFISSESVAMPN